MSIRVLRASKKELVHLFYRRRYRFVRAHEGAACQEAKESTYDDFHVCDEVDRIAFQHLLLKLPSLLLWRALCDVPDEVIASVKALGCFFTGVNDTNKKRQQKEIPIWCESHKRVEKMVMFYSVVLALSLERPQGQDRSNGLVSSNERSHLCHNGACDASYHFCKGSGRENRARVTCANAMKRLLRRSTLQKALEEGRAACLHMPACWPEGCTPCISAEKSVETMQAELAAAWQMQALVSVECKLLTSQFAYGGLSPSVKQRRRYLTVLGRHGGRDEAQFGKMSRKICMRSTVDFQRLILSCTCPATSSSTQSVAQDTPNQSSIIFSHLNTCTLFSKKKRKKKKLDDWRYWEL
jgi:hypothetical protein